MASGDFSQNTGLHLNLSGFRFVQTSTLQETRVVPQVQAVFDALKEALAVVFVIAALW